MNISFAPVADAFIRQMVETGYYGNATELVRDAVRRLREESATKSNYNNPLFDAVMKAARNLAKGPPLTRYSPALMQEISESAAKRAFTGEQPSADVIPQ